MHLAIGDVATITLKLDVAKYYPSELVNRVEVCGQYNGAEWICASNFSALELNWLSCCLDEPVSVTKTARLEDGNSSLVWYTVEIRNNDNVIRAATVTDRLPVGMDLVESSVPFASYEDGVVVWNLVEIGPFDTATIEFSALAPGDGRFTNTVEDECGSVSCDGWQPPNWDLEHAGYQPDELTCEDLTFTGCDGTASCDETGSCTAP